MHKPTDDEKRTFARQIAKELSAKLGRDVTIRQVRKMRQRGEIKSRPAEMVCHRPR